MIDTMNSTHSAPTTKIRMKIEKKKTVIQYKNDEEKKVLDIIWHSESVTETTYRDKLCKDDSGLFRRQQVVTLTTHVISVQSVIYVRCILVS